MFDFIWIASGNQDSEIKNNKNLNSSFYLSFGQEI